MNVLRFLILFLNLITSAFAAPSFLTVADIHYDTKNRNHPKEDIGPEFLMITLNEFSLLSQKVDFIINLGDLPTHFLFHNAWTKQKKREDEATVFHQFFLADVGHKPMFYVPGNNDSLEGNYHVFQSQGQSPLSLASDWTGACVFCEGLVIDSRFMQTGGYYSSYVIPGNKEVLLIALNTSPLSPNYVGESYDALSELNWLESQLKAHHAKQLLIAMHIPPGQNHQNMPMWKKGYLKRFMQILAQYKPSFNEITLLTAHTHMDGIRKITLNPETTLYAYSTPSISRSHYNNSAMKVFLLDNALAVKDYITYYTPNISKWEKNSYQALGSISPIFPHCAKSTLANCLNALSEEQICRMLEAGNFYTVKTPDIPGNACMDRFTISANSGF